MIRPLLLEKSDPQTMLNSDSEFFPEESSYINCIRCGLCLSVCPTYREHKHEASSPRGRVGLARKGLQG